MTVFDTVGKVINVEKRALRSGENQWHLAAFQQSGLFLIRLKTVDGQKALKIVVQ